MTVLYNSGAVLLKSFVYANVGRPPGDLSPPAQQLGRFKETIYLGKEGPLARNNKNKLYIGAQ